MAIVSVDKEKCTGCGACIDICPFGAPSLEGDTVVVNDQCTACGACLDVCPVNALSLPELELADTKPDLTDYEGVWV
jgi:electron transfer flavoprotein alpha subunit